VVSRYCAARTFRSGRFEFRCELFPEKTLKCKIEVRHISPKGMGTKIREIDGRGTSLVQLYLQEQYSLKLNKS